MKAFTVIFSFYFYDKNYEKFSFMRPHPASLPPSLPSSFPHRLEARLLGDCQPAALDLPVQV